MYQSMLSKKPGTTDETGVNKIKTKSNFSIL